MRMILRSGVFAEMAANIAICIEQNFNYKN